jgi:hypothetical protein
MAFLCFLRLYAPWAKRGGRAAWIGQAGGLKGVVEQQEEESQSWYPLLGWGYFGGRSCRACLAKDPVPVPSSSSMRFLVEAGTGDRGSIMAPGRAAWGYAISRFIHRQQERARQ